MKMNENKADVNLTEPAEAASVTGIAQNDEEDHAATPSNELIRINSKNDPGVLRKEQSFEEAVNSRTFRET